MRNFKTIAICLATLCLSGAFTACSTTKNAAGKMAPAKKGYAETGKYRN